MCIRDRYYDCEGECLNDLNGNGVCDELEIEGCVFDIEACNYNANATIIVDCDYESCQGCTDIDACNYDSLATLDYGCEYCYLNDCVLYPNSYYDCSGNCINDNDGDGICNTFDNCPEDFNPFQEDSNVNNIGDICEIQVVDSETTICFGDSVILLSLIHI